MFSCVPHRIGIENIGFWGEEKSGVPGEKPLGESRELTTNPTHIWRRDRGAKNPGYICERRVLSPLHHPCSPRISAGIRVEIPARNLPWGCQFEIIVLLFLLVLNPAWVQSVLIIDSPNLALFFISRILYSKFHLVYYNVYHFSLKNFINTCIRQD